MPITAVTCWIGALALIGTPFFSGFYSKDAIIEAVGQSHRAFAGYAYVCVLGGVFVTALYTFRMLFMTFHGEERFRHPERVPPSSSDKTVGHEEQAAEAHGEGDDRGHEPHESPAVVTVPLIALAIPSVLIGFFTVGSVLYGDYFGGSIKVLEQNNVLGEMAREFHGAGQAALHGLMQPPFWFAAAGVFTAWLFFLRRPSLADQAARSLSLLRTILVNKYFFDWFNENIIAALTRGIGIGLWKAGDQGLIDGALVNGSAHTVGWLGGLLRKVQSGYLYSYAFWMVIGLAVLLGWFLHRVSGG
jgi:NADH-quinone oxidoreductase subunit L